MISERYQIHYSVIIFVYIFLIWYFSKYKKDAISATNVWRAVKRGRTVTVCPLKVNPTPSQHDSQDFSNNVLLYWLFPCLMPQWDSNLKAELNSELGCRCTWLQRQLSVLQISWWFSSATFCWWVFSGAKVQACPRYVDVFNWRPNMVAADQNPVPALITRFESGFRATISGSPDDPQAEMFPKL